MITRALIIVAVLLVGIAVGITLVPATVPVPLLIDMPCEPVKSL